MCKEIWAKAAPYFHRWRPTDMVVWDNLRMLHSVSGHEPALPRVMHRTTVQGDYAAWATSKATRRATVSSR